ncbi:hypothetical protein UlMin_031470 [Ulmus minor]
MKRAIPWDDNEDDSSSDGSSASEPEDGAKVKPEALSKASQVNSGKGKKSSGVDFEALKKYGYKGGPSVLRVPPPKEAEKQDWSWSNGKEKREAKESEESYAERMKTRAALAQGEALPTVVTRQDRKNASFSQKEKRKRELGQASRGKNYVEEEKRLLRDSGIYSGFDT